MFDSADILNILLGVAMAFIALVLLSPLLAMQIYRWFKRRHQRRQQARADALLQFVRRGGWYPQEDSEPLAARLADLPVPAMGKFRGLYQRREGETLISLFRLDREGDSLSSSAEGHQMPGMKETALLMENPEWELPPFYLLYTHHMPRLVTAWMPVSLPSMTGLTWPNEDVPEFASRFRLSTPSRHKSEVHAFFSRARRQALVRSFEVHPPLGRMTMMVVQGQGHCLFMHDINHVVPSHRLAEFVEQTTAVAKVFTAS